jgi:flagellar motor switch protein FliM
MPEMTAVADAPFDFRQSAQIPDAQLDAIRVLHESFIHNLCESLTLALRAEVAGAIASVEQASFAELAESIATPACLLYFSMPPHEGSMLIEVSQSLVAPILDCVLGGNGKIVFGLDREITDIEQAMLEGFFGILAHELREAWKPVAPIEFQFDGVEAAPQTSPRFAAGDALILVAADLRVGENEGRLNVAIPALALKLLRQKSESRPETRKSGSHELEQAMQQKLAAGLKLDIDCALVGSSIRLRDLLKLKPGDLIDTGIGCDGAATILVNGVPKFRGEVTVEGDAQAVVIQATAQSQSARDYSPARQP